MIDHRIHTFITLCEAKSYTKTAQKLCMTQPGVTQHIKFLERHYNTQLVENTASGVRLTEAGEVFYRYCVEINSQSLAIKKYLEKYQGKPVKLAVGATLTIGEFVLPTMLAHYVKDYPEQALTMKVENTQALVGQVERGELDCAFIEGYFNQEKFVTHLLRKEPFVLVASPNHRLAQLEKISLADLVEETVILREEGSGTREIFENALREHQYGLVNFEKILEVGNMGAIKQLVKAGIGYTMLYEAAVKKEILSGELVILPVEDLILEKAFYFIYMKNNWREQDYLTLLEYAKGDEK